MLIGVPKEIKEEEYRIGLTPAGARELVQELGAEKQFNQHLSPWRGKYKKRLEKYEIRL